MDPMDDDAGDLFRFAAVVSLMQSVLFVAIGASAVVLGVDRLVDDGFASLATSNPAAFRVLCAAFVAIAVLGLAITPAEYRAVADRHSGWAGFGANLAYVGHAATAAFFAWWLVATRHGAPPATADDVAPLEWGAAFELVLVGAWVWIIAGLIRVDDRWPRRFVWLSIAKATSFWLAYLTLFTNSTTATTVTVGAVTLVTGPAWHAWIAVIFRHVGIVDRPR